ncbi:capsular polysaccharide export protein, LipB/KpsS family [Grimontia hollisae]|uniref:capsular polysaccharide export protein, LipB/KpsS family n=1 Tax=Grimontia hollisae TaxID=673 RepID=UPI0013039365|nr:hypothetical protein [Grimontia hollisae]
MDLNIRTLRHNTMFWGFFQNMEVKYINYISKTLRIKKVHVSKSSVNYNIFRLVSRSATPEKNYILPLGWMEKFISNHFYEFIFNYDRYSSKFEKNAITAHEDKTHSDYLCAIRYYLNFFYSTFKHHDISQVIFNNPPHQGMDHVIYFLAEEMGLDINILYQTIIPNRFFCYKKKSDFGYYEKFITYTNAGDYSFERKFEKKLFYMEKGDTSSLFVVKGIVRKIGLYSRKIRKLIKKFKNKNDFEKLIDHRKKKLRSKIVYNSHSRFYLKHSKVAESIDINLDEKFVYFPLHYQPELTTSALGGLYNDQLLAIENLSQVLPDNWMIYVKENPKQGHYMREKSFYERLSKVKSAKLVSKNISTYDLLKSCKIVATISGTVGWESLSGGKPVVIFGMAWYRNFTGCFKYTHDIDLASISEQQVNYDVLQNEVNEFSNSCNKGIISTAYTKLFNDYNVNMNNAYLLNFFDKLTRVEM